MEKRAQTFGSWTAMECDYGTDGGAPAIHGPQTDDGGHIVIGFIGQRGHFVVVGELIDDNGDPMEDTQISFNLGSEWTTRAVRAAVAGIVVQMLDNWSHIEPAMACVDALAGWLGWQIHDRQLKERD